MAELVVDDVATGHALENLSRFNSDITLKQATYAFIASQLMSKDERDNLSRVFKAFDKDCDGKLSKDEVKEGYLEHYDKVMSDEEVDAMFHAVDTDRSGYIDYTEFVIAATSQNNYNSQDRLLAAFNMFDRDNSGVISAEEIREVLCFGG